jgi:hypothetical protein
MIFLIGLRRRATRLGTVFLMCSACHTPAAQVLACLRRYFTVFFVPVLPLGSTYTMTCTMCGQCTKVNKEAIDAYLTPVIQRNVGVPGFPSGLGYDRALGSPSSEAGPAEGTTEFPQPL